MVMTTPRGTMATPLGHPMHTMGLCAECDLRMSLGHTLDVVERWHYRNMIGENVWKAFTFAWAVGAAPQRDIPTWSRPPEHDEVRDLLTAVFGDGWTGLTD
jgi:hypothetical protein